jgi:hypothetical protein
MGDNWIEGIKDKFLQTCPHCEKGDACSCPNVVAYRIMLGQVVSALEESLVKEADAWNRGFDVAKQLYKKKVT